jgi:colanic acid/amylovoran biosynthesis glycosyltransferase
MRIAIVVNRFPTLSETFIFNKVKGLIRQGFDITVITHGEQSDRAAYRDELAELGSVRIERAFSKLDFFRLRLYARILSSILQSIAFLKTLVKSDTTTTDMLRRYLLWLSMSSRFDIVHFEYTGLAITYLDVLRHLRPAKIFVSCRGAAEQIKPLVEGRRAMQLRQLFQRVDRVHCVSDDMLDTCVTLYGLDPAKAFVNRPAIHTDKFRRGAVADRVPPGLFRFCSTGRLHWKKGFEYALLAMKELNHRGHFFNYEIIGSGIELEKLIFMSHDLGIQDSVSFSGSLTSSEVKLRLENCDVYVLPSLSEGISNAVLEAMAMEVPVVATRAGGMEEVIRDKETGLLVESCNPEQLADALERLILDESLRKRLAQNGCALVRAGFTIDRQIDAFREQYENSVHA